MTGILVEIGRGKMTDKDIIYFLNNRTPEPAKYTAPPSGLFLESVRYQKSERPAPLEPVKFVNSFI